MKFFDERARDLKLIEASLPEVLSSSQTNVTKGVEGNEATSSLVGIVYFLL